MYEGGRGEGRLVEFQPMITLLRYVHVYSMQTFIIIGGTIFIILFTLEDHGLGTWPD